MKKKSKKAKWQEALQIAKERREAKIKGERDRYQTKCRFDKPTNNIIVNGKKNGKKHFF